MSASLEIVKLNEELVRKNIQISDQGKRMSEIKAENGMLHLQITELEKERNALKFANTEAKEYIESELGFRFITVCPSKPFNTREHQAIRDLEQQKIGIQNATAKVDTHRPFRPISSYDGDTKIDADMWRKAYEKGYDDALVEVKHEGVKLQEQAKALRGE